MSLAGATLAVAAGLLALAAAAWLRLRAQPDGDHGDDAAARVAGEHLAPLAQWALGVLTLHAICLIAAGDAGVGAWALTAVLAVVAAGLQHPPAPHEYDEDNAEDTPAPAPAREPEAAHEPIRAGSPLWAGRSQDATTRSGLWTE